MHGGVIGASADTLLAQRHYGRTSTSSASVHTAVEDVVPKLIDVLLRNRHELLTVLTKIATAQAAGDELLRLVRALAGVPGELLRNSPRRLARLATFLPSNNLLYSYVLFGVVPSLYTDEVRLRPSARVARAALAVHEVLGPSLRRLGAGRIVMTRAPRRSSSPTVPAPTPSSSPAARRGDTVWAFVESADPDHRAVAARVTEACRRTLPPHARPRAVRVVPRLPRTGSGKSDRVRLRGWASGTATAAA